MDHIGSNIIPIAGKPQKNEAEPPSGNSMSSSKPQKPASNPETVWAAKKVSRLLGFYGDLDVADPRAFSAALVKTFSEYAPAVVEQAIDPVRGIPSRCKVLRIATIREILDEINAPFKREEARQLARERNARLLPPPNHKRTPEEQARVDRQVAEVRKAFGLPQDGLERRGNYVARRSDNMPIKAPASKPADGQHAKSIAHELERRKANPMALEAGDDDAVAEKSR